MILIIAMMMMTTMMMMFDRPPAQPLNVSALLKGFANCCHLVQVEVRMMLIIIILFNSMKRIIVNYEEVSFKQPIHVPEQK